MPRKGNEKASISAWNTRADSLDLATLRAKNAALRERFSEDRLVDLIIQWERPCPPEDSIRRHVQEWLADSAGEGE